MSRGGLSNVTTPSRVLELCTAEIHGDISGCMILLWQIKIRRSIKVEISEEILTEVFTHLNGCFREIFIM